MAGDKVPAEKDYGTITTRCNVLVELAMALRRGIKKYLNAETRWTQNNGTEAKRIPTDGAQEEKGCLL